ncbi:hypothetical protein POSPLADRAFT_1050348 [Postia placenta MAD-698-R-SB12]|uniref:Uncharacterized protein n=1 Tax=Postia placenta MAD-698-R-SB12 TaxID=670580 RepID=A0A1X6MKP4_9APHY|nr:hypothetical protein POSPLADRAFT_1050348 [Postia placenta MAD-698-R-SB12]OSX56935.1 hypothetical protein POSPLADRAFT_1050348 [Postia placenta MAD-698-R-SB12]
MFVPWHNAHWSQGWLWSGPITAQKRAVAYGVPKGKGVRLTALQRGLVETYVRDVTKLVVRAWGGNDMHVRVQFSGYGSWTAVSANIPVQGLTRQELGIWVYTLILQSVELCRRELPLSNEPRSLSFRGNQPLAIDDLFVFGLSKVYLLIKRHMTTPTLLSWFDNRSRIPRCLRHCIKHHF